jgi:hypothetical protein
MRPTSKIKAAAAVVACVSLGAVAGIAGAAASTSSSSTAKSQNAERGWYRLGPGGMREARLGFHGRAVHVVATVLNKAHTGFITVTEDHGTVQSVSGNQLTIKEAADGVTYRTLTLTIPSGATVMRDFQSSALSALKAGDRVSVAQSSEGTTVFAIDPNAMPKPPGGLRGWHPGNGPGPGSAPAPGAMPYGPPPAGA